MLRDLGGCRVERCGVARGQQQVAPAPANANASERPNPRLAPVIQASLPSKRRPGGSFNRAKSLLLYSKQRIDKPREARSRAALGRYRLQLLHQEPL